MYKVVGLPRTRVFRVLWMLEELGLHYDLDPVAPGSAEAKAYHPLGKIPVLCDGDVVLSDSVAIMTYLADKHGALTSPPGTHARARQDAMTQWLVDNMDAVLWTHAKHTRILPEARRAPDVGPALEAEFADAATWLADQLHDDGGLMGPELSLPDILAVHLLSWSFAVGFPALPPALRAYSKRMRSRPAYRAAAAR